MQTKSRVSFTLDIEIVRRLKEMQSKDCMNISKVVNNCLLEYLFKGGAK